MSGPEKYESCNCSREMYPRGSFDHHGPSPNEFPPPEPPKGPGEWDLQYCKWWGWTWVRKGDSARPPNAATGAADPRRVTTGGGEPAALPPQPTPSVIAAHRHRRKNFFSNCFGKKKPPIQMPRPQPPPPPQPQQQNIAQQVNSEAFMRGQSAKKKKRRHRDYDSDETSSEDSCCCCRCCCCCPQPMCYPCSPCGPCPQVQYRKMHAEPPSKPMREQGTAVSRTCICKDMGQNTSQMKISKKRKNCCKKNKKRCCCNCVRPICCCNPCPHPGQYSFPNNNNHNTHATGSQSPPVRVIPPQDTNNINTNTDTVSNMVQFLNNRPTYYQKEPAKDGFSSGRIGHRPLDLLLKNNINITRLFANKSFAKPEDRYPNMDGNDTISYLSGHTAQRHESEHRKLLTSICDAILSNHKIDDDRNPIVEGVLRNARSNSTQLSKSSFSSLNSHIDRILNGSSQRYRLKTKRKSEIGTQAGKNPKAENCTQTQPKWMTKKTSRIPTPLTGKKMSRTPTFVVDSGTKLRRGRRMSDEHANNSSDNHDSESLENYENYKGHSEDISNSANAKLEDIERILSFINYDIGGNVSSTIEPPETLFQRSRMNSSFGTTKHVGDKNLPSTSK